MEMENKGVKKVHYFFYFIGSFLFYTWLSSRIFSLTRENFFNNIPLLLLVFSFFLMIFRRVAAAYCISVGFEFLLYYINEYVYSSRLTYVQFHDLYCIRDALRIAGKYTLPMNYDIFWNLMTVVSSMVIVLFLEKRLKEQNFLRQKFLLNNLLTIIICGYVIAIFCIWVVLLPPRKVSFDMNTYTRDCGLPYALLCEYRQSGIDKPADYSIQNLAEIKERYQSDEMILSDPESINVIVIMNESLADYSYLSENTLLKDPLPEIHALSKEENCKTGLAVVAIRGGGHAIRSLNFSQAVPLHSFRIVPYRIFNT